MPRERRTRSPASSTASRDRGGRAGRSRAETRMGGAYLTRTPFATYSVRNERCSTTREPAMSATALAASPAAIPAERHRLRWAILAIVLVAEVMDLLDGTIVNVAAPSIRR